MKMSNAELNQLLHRAVESLQLEQNTLIVLTEVGGPLLPEGYWREQHEQAQTAAINKTAELFERSLDVARVKMKRRAEDERLAHLSVDELLDDSAGALWQPDPMISWGSLAMARSGGTLRPPMVGDLQPTYDYECYQCGRPITERSPNHWVDHSCDTHCDGALMLDVECEDWHLPKPVGG